MTDTSRSSTDDLQFATAEAVGASSVPEAHACVLCQQPITSTYFALGDHLLCPACSEKAQAPPTGSSFGRAIKASLLGLGAGLIGALIWFAIRRVAHLEIGLVAILVGFMVGKAVRFGSGGRGGLAYQILAVALTYGCIAVNYMPDVLEAVFAGAADARAVAANAPADPAAVAGNAAGEQPLPAAVAPPVEVSTGEMLVAVATLLVLAFGIAMAAPFLAGMENLIGLLIIGFALWEAWKFNARRPLPISGPFQLAPPPAH